MGMVYDGMRVFGLDGIFFVLSLFLFFRCIYTG